MCDGGTPAPGSQLAWSSAPGISAIGCNLSSSRSVSGERSPCACKRGGVCFHSLFVPHHLRGFRRPAPETVRPGNEDRYARVSSLPSSRWRCSRSGRERSSIASRPMSVPHAPIPGKADAQSASSSASTRACVCAAAASSAPSRRTPGSVSHASSDRIQRAGHLRDHQFTRRRGTSAAQFARVV